MIVLKFGGTSVANLERVLNAIEIVTYQPSPSVVVVSAAGGVTNLLLEAIAAAGRNESEASLQLAHEVIDRHAGIVAGIESSQLRTTAETNLSLLHDALFRALERVSLTGESRRDSDAIVATGEKAMSVLMAGLMCDRGLPATYLFADQVIATDDRFGNARPDRARTQVQAEALVRPLLDAGQTVIVTGFIGGAPNGETTTLGRGGSDYSATLLGAALRAEEVQIWTDVPGVLTADPRLVESAVVVPQISFDEAQELAHFGAKVLHPRTIRPAVAMEIPVRILSTFAPTELGTLVTRHPSGDQVKAVTAMKNLLLVTIDVPELEDLSGAASQVFGALHEDRVDVVLASQASSRRRMTYLLDAGPLGTCQRISDRLNESLVDFEAEVGCTEDVALVAAVGHGAAGEPRALTQLLGVLEKEAIPVLASSQQMSNVALVAAIPAGLADQAVCLMHDSFIGPQFASAGSRRRRRSDLMSESLRVG